MDQAGDVFLAADVCNDRGGQFVEVNLATLLGRRGLRVGGGGDLPGADGPLLEVEPGQLVGRVGYQGHDGGVLAGGRDRGPVHRGNFLAGAYLVANLDRNGEGGALHFDGVDPHVDQEVEPGGGGDADGVLGVGDHYHLAGGRGQDLVRAGVNAEALAHHSGGEDLVLDLG